MPDQTFPFPLVKANDDYPFNPWASRGDPYRGSPDDSAMYLAIPGSNFLRPWIAVPDGPAFIWPLGLEGFSLSIDPTLGIHRYIGDNKVEVDVVHKGEERISMSGMFPGDSSSDAVRKLRDVVYADTPNGGKILFIPHILPYAQRVVVANARFDHAQDEFGSDLTYSVEFVRMGYVAGRIDDSVVSAPTQPRSGSTSAGTKVFKTTAKYNTLRLIAAYKLGNAAKWQTLYNLNQKLFKRLNVTASKAPNYRLAVGTTVYYG